MLWFKKKKKEKQKEEPVEDAETVKPQKKVNGFLRGMYCEACGYMEVNENSNELPLEGFAMCPNCGAPLKTGWFMKDDQGFHLAENADRIIAVEKPKKLTGGHHRVRKPGPAIMRRKVSHHR